jgi:hypothetical protein
MGREHWFKKSLAFPGRCAERPTGTAVDEQGTIRQPLRNRSIRG